MTKQVVVKKGFGGTRRVSDGHTHRDKNGSLHWCYHQCKSRWYLWLPLVFLFQVFMFPLEHQAAEWLWQQPGVSIIAETMGWDEFLVHEEPTHDEHE